MSNLSKPLLHVKYPTYLEFLHKTSFYLMEYNIEEIYINPIQDMEFNVSTCWAVTVSTALASLASHGEEVA